MARPANVLSRHELNSTATGDNVREDLTDIIYNISPTERPFHQNVGRGDATSDKHEWLIDELAAAVNDNAHVDGDDFAAEGAASGTGIGEQLGDGSGGVVINGGNRLANYQQISRKDIVVTRRANIVRKAGRRSELNYQIAKAGRELQRDCEFAATANQPGVEGSATVAPRTAGLPQWFKTNTNRSTGGTDPVFTTGVPSTAAATLDGTATRTASEAALLGLIAEVYVEGGDPDMIMLHPSAKQRFSSYMFGTSARIATQYQDAGPKPSKGLTAVGAVDVYVSDFGVLDVVPNRFMRERDLFVLETEMWAITYLDGYHIEKIGKTGDSEKRVLLTDWGVKCNNEAASGHYADLNTTAWAA